MFMLEKNIKMYVNWLSFNKHCWNQRINYQILIFRVERSGLIQPIQKAPTHNIVHYSTVRYTIFYILILAL